MAFKKRPHPKFNVPNFGAINRKRVKERWRKQRGDDNKKRIKRRFMGAEPNIGWGNPADIRGVRASGKRAILIENAQQLNALLSNPEVADYEVTLAGSLSRKKRIELTEMASRSKVNVTNGARK